MAARRRHLQRRRRARGQGHQGRRVRRVRGDPGGRRGARAHLRARPAARREPARDRPAGRRREGQDPRDRLRAPPPLAVDQARRGPGAAARDRWPDGDVGRRRRRPRERARAGAVRGRLRRTPAEAEDARRGRGRGGRRRRGAEPRRGRRVEAPAEDEPAARRRGRRSEPAAEESPEERAPSAAVRRPDRRHRRREVRGAGRARSASAPRRCPTDAVVHELYDDPEVRDAVVARWGDEVAPGGASTAPRSPGARSPTDEEREVARGPAVAAGRASGSREWRAGGGGARAGRRARSWSRCRCCSRPGWTRRSTLRSRSWPTRPSGRERAGARGHAALDERTARQLTQEEKAARATYAVANSGTLEELEQSCPAYLRS